MAGRRSRSDAESDSDSSVQTIDESRLLWRPETEVLKKTRPRLPPDSWPIFALNEATLYKQDRKTLANALEVDFDGPFIVRGRVEMEDKLQAQRMRLPGVQSAYIEIEASHSYSIGYGPYAVLWVAGEAGWYEINPSPRYQALYDTTCEAITAYYHIMDIYNSRTRKGIGVREQRKLFKKLDLKEVFYQHAKMVGDGAVLKDVVAQFDQAARFMMAHFPKEEEFSWTDTSFYSWMRRRHPEIEGLLAEKAAAPPAVAAASREASDSADVDMIDLTSVASSASPQPQQRDAKVEAELASRPKHEPRLPGGETSAPPDESAVDEQTVVDKLLAHIEVAGSEWTSDGRDLAKFRLTTLVSWMYRCCKIPADDYKAAKDVVPHYSPLVVRQLGSEWHAMPFFADLKDAARKPPPLEFTHTEVLAQLVRRVPRGKTHTAGASQAASKPPAKKPLSTPTGRRAGKMAVLRPSTGKTLKRTRDDMERDSADDTRSGATSDGDTADSDATKTSFFSWRARRNQQAIDDDELQSRVERDASPQPPTPRVKYYRIDDMPPSPPSQAPAWGARRPAGSSLPPADVDARRLVIRRLPAVDTTPRGPQGAWQCAENDCRHVVHRADDAEGQRRVHAHIATHTESARLVKLAVLEGGRGNTSVDHLLDKIRKKGEEDLYGRVLKDGEASPTLPIKRADY